MSRAAAALALLLPAALLAQNSWLVGPDGDPPPPPPKGPDRGVPEWVEGAEGAPRPRGLPGYPTRPMRLKARQQPLKKVLDVTLQMAFPEAARPRLDLPRSEWDRVVTLGVDGPLEQALEALMVASRSTLWIEDGVLHFRPGYRNPPRRPPTPEELDQLSRSVQIRADDQRLSQVMGVLGSFTGLTPLVPDVLAVRGVDLDTRGSLAHCLEALSVALGAEVWVDGPYLRIADEYSPRRPSEAALGIPATGKPVGLKARDQELSKVIGILGRFTGALPAVPGTLERMHVDIEIRDVTTAEALAELSRRYPFEAWVDGPFLRVEDPRRPKGPPPFPGEAWRAYRELLTRGTMPEDLREPSDLGDDFDPAFLDDLGGDDGAADDFGDL